MPLHWPNFDLGGPVHQTPHTGRQFPLRRRLPRRRLTHPRPPSSPASFYTPISRRNLFGTSQARLSCRTIAPTAVRSVRTARLPAHHHLLRIGPSSRQRRRLLLVRVIVQHHGQSSSDHHFSPSNRDDSDNEDDGKLFSDGGLRGNDAADQTTQQRRRRPIPTGDFRARVAEQEEEDEDDNRREVH